MHIQDGYLFQGNRLCIPRSFLRDQIIWELHGGGQSGHFKRGKTITLVEERNYWPQLKKDVGNLVCRCPICQTTKGHTKNIGLYLSLPIPMAPWEDVSMDFVLGLTGTQQGADSIMIIVMDFQKWLTLLLVGRRLTLSKWLTYSFERWSIACSTEVHCFQL